MYVAHRAGIHRLYCTWDAHSATQPVANLYFYTFAPLALLLFWFCCWFFSEVAIVGCVALSIFANFICSLFLNFSQLFFFCIWVCICYVDPDPFVLWSIRSGWWVICTRRMSDFLPMIREMFITFIYLSFSTACDLILFSVLLN